MIMFHVKHDYKYTPIKIFSTWFDPCFRPTCRKTYTNTGEGGEHEKIIKQGDTQFSDKQNKKTVL